MVTEIIVQKSKKAKHDVAAGKLAKKALERCITIIKDKEVLVNKIAVYLLKKTIKEELENLIYKNDN